MFEKRKKVASSTVVVVVVVTTGELLYKKKKKHSFLSMEYHTPTACAMIIVPTVQLAKIKKSLEKKTPPLYLFIASQ